MEISENTITECKSEVISQEEKLIKELYSLKNLRRQMKLNKELSPNMLQKIKKNIQTLITQIENLLSDFSQFCTFMKAYKLEEFTNKRKELNQNYLQIIQQIKTTINYRNFATTTPKAGQTIQIQHKKQYSKEVQNKDIQNLQQDILFLKEMFKNLHEKVDQYIHKASNKNSSEIYELQSNVKALQQQHQQDREQIAQLQLKIKQLQSSLIEEPIRVEEFQEVIPRKSQIARQRSATPYLIPTNKRIF